jgi:SOS-response transcriptional repressor LexA
MDTQELINQVFEQARMARLVKTRADFADLLDINRSSLSAAMNGNEKYLTDSLEKKVRKFHETHLSEDGDALKKGTLPVIPTEALAGTLGEFADSVHLYECERMISPIKGADYAIKVHGDSMSPEYPSGSIAIIKRVNEKAFLEWGKVYVLDTENGAVIKKIRKTENDNEVECVSINPNYQPFRINYSFIHGWYRVLMVLSLK